MRYGGGAREARPNGDGGCGEAVEKVRITSSSSENQVPYFLKVGVVPIAFFRVLGAAPESFMTKCRLSTYQGVDFCSAASSHGVTPIDGCQVIGCLSRKQRCSR